MNGNHSRIDRKEDALKDERLDSLVLFCASKSLAHINNIFIEPGNCHFDSTIGFLEIRGKTYLFVHGDYDHFDKSGVANLVLALGFVPDVIVYGHGHTPAYNEINGIEMVRSGCVGGSGDDYTIAKRLTGKPRQMVCVCKSDGIESLFPVRL